MSSWSSCDSRARSASTGRLQLEHKITVQPRRPLRRVDRGRQRQRRDAHHAPVTLHREVRHEGVVGRVRSESQSRSPDAEPADQQRRPRRSRHAEAEGRPHEKGQQWKGLRERAERVMRSQEDPPRRRSSHRPAEPTPSLIRDNDHDTRVSERSPIARTTGATRMTPLTSAVHHVRSTVQKCAFAVREAHAAAIGAPALTATRARSRPGQRGQKAGADARRPARSVGPASSPRRTHRD